MSQVPLNPEPTRSFVNVAPNRERQRVSNVIRAPLLLLCITMGGVLLALAWWLNSDHRRDAQLYHQERALRVAHIKTATDFGLQMWQARMALVMTWSNPRDLARVIRAEQAMADLNTEALRYHPQTESGANIKRLVPQYIAEAQVMFDYFRTIEAAVSYGVLGSGDVYRDYALHVANGAYTHEWSRQALIAVNHLQRASLYYNGFIAGMRQSYLDQALSNTQAAIDILERHQDDAATQHVLVTATRYQEAMRMLDQGIAEYQRAHRTSIKIGLELNRALTDLQNRLGEQGFNFADDRLEDAARKMPLVSLMVLVSLIIMTSLLWLAFRIRRSFHEGDFELKNVDNGEKGLSVPSASVFSDADVSVEQIQQELQQVLARVTQLSAQLNASGKDDVASSRGRHT
ncbi:hypothetical protein HGP28_15850 [Vibrio sp. SM6]|uniref:Chemotaxis protein n=1 Tax=Vibrio agarilyticus TaxID=2726741 RepID=A0A7X8TT58_9VIBR|nr:hypothetical protein [Vibrio agarilyticus]NLS14354.1 hypothetical protein [Vibrio agarilyticus]